MSTIYVELLGSPRFSVDSREVSFARRRSKALLCYLIATERRATREELADLFWPESNASRAMGSLRTVISEIKSLFQGAFLHSEGNLLYFDTEHIHCDLLVFRNILSGKPTYSDMREAAALWKGGFLKGFSIDASSGFYNWQLQEERTVFYAYKQLLRSLYDYEINNGDLSTALQHAYACLHLDNFDEECHRAVIYIHALRGERKLAFEQYEICQTIMMEEFQSEIEAETQALVQNIKSGEIRKNGKNDIGESHIPRIAILPFNQIAINNNNVFLFLNMVMEALEDFFAVLPELRIISRTSTLAYVDSSKRLSLIAAELQADYLIEGFCQGNESSLLIEGRLVHTKPDEVVAVKSITVSPHNDNPVHIARHIGQAITIYFDFNHSLEKEELENVKTQQNREKVSTLNSKLKLHAKHLLRIDEEAFCLKAVEMYREAVRLDPSDAEAWAGIGSAMLAYFDKGICFPNRADELTEVELTANKALEIDEKEPTALTILGNIAVQKDWDAVRAEAFYKKALQIRPNSTRTMRDYAELCIMTGRYEEASALSEVINSLDPLNHHNLKIRFWLKIAYKDFTKAEELVNQHFLLYPAPPLDRILQAHIQMIKGDSDAAIKILGEIDMEQEMPLFWFYSLLVVIGYTHAVKKEGKDAYQVIERLQKSRSGYMYPYVPIAQIYTGLEDFDAAVSWIETAVEAHDPGLFFLAVNPLFIPLNNDPRMVRLIQKTPIIPIKK